VIIHLELTDLKMIGQKVIMRYKQILDGKEAKAPMKNLTVLLQEEEEEEEDEGEDEDEDEETLEIIEDVVQVKNFIIFKKMKKVVQ